MRDKVREGDIGKREREREGYIERVREKRRRRGSL